MKRTPGALSPLALAALMTFAGCSKEPTKPAPEDPRKSIEGVMQELIDAVEARDMYAALPYPDDFLFVFDEGDVAWNRNLPLSWDWPEEVAANEALFHSPLVVVVMARSASPFQAAQ